ncbi:discoidin domain-containing protein [Luteolibacter yonseiensis]|uniref:Discoidin domain-containing protein n=1 Tax=Luteolibacter yonseiensis TaxID=1144680 RepID=A0A934VAL7_9BACT|nr:histidine kinase [Luteolibacter yonseiensis]MBK1814509.1 discoidin domain-containing protein [Luteolibacter yonseiensis]
MNGFPGLLRYFCVSLLAATGVVAAEATWDSRLTEVFSNRWKVVQKQLGELNPELEKLPNIPIDDQGGTGGYVGNYQQAGPSQDSQMGVEVRWRDTPVVDLVALVPARRYDANGLDPQYGLPEDFTVELLDGSGAVIREVASERSTSGNLVRKGLPFVYKVEPPVAAAGLRITAARLKPDPENKGQFIHAWAEAMVFSGARNIAYAAEVRSLGGGTPSTPWHWKPAFLVDGKTPLGLPEIPGEEHGNTGWMSEARESATDATSLKVDLRELATIDSVLLFPAKRPTSDLPSGFGFPRKLVISVSESAGSENWKIIATRDFANPGHNPVLVSFEPVGARQVKVEATQLWKAFDEFPAFFALSELEILSGENNLALGKGVQSPDSMSSVIAPGGRFWSTAALSDGFGPDGRLASEKEWMKLLDQRVRLETRRHDLLAESRQLVTGWRQAAQICFGLLVLAGGFLIVALPIRYRLHANRELTKVRERIAGDLHDEVGSNLGSIQMIADLAEGRSGPSAELKRIQRIAAETVSAVRDIVWLLRPTGDHRIGTVEHLRETSSIMLETLEWKFTANEEAWQVELPEESNRDLFLFFREALHNIMRHAKAATVEIHAEKVGNVFRLNISDNGVGIEPAKLERPATLRALRQRTESLGAELQVESSAETGTRLVLAVPLERRKKR